MRSFLSLVIACLLCPAMALADTCRDEIAAMYDTGPLDPRTRPPHAHENEVRAPDGSLTRVFETRIESPLRSVSGVQGSGLYALVIENRSWTGPTIDGPWAENPNRLPDNRAALADRMRIQQQANLDDVACPGLVDVDGAELLNVQFVTRTDPDPDMGGAWFGAKNSVFIDPDTQRVMRWEMTDFRNSWSDGVSRETHKIVYRYDDAIRLVAPD